LEGQKDNESQQVCKKSLSDVNYNDNETVDRMYQYGTLGYAAPECYSKAAEDSKFPFTVNFEQGKMSVESDIFSFGATFWNVSIYLNWLPKISCFLMIYMSFTGKIF